MFQTGGFWFALAGTVVLYWNIPHRFRGSLLIFASLLLLLSIDPRGPLLALLLTTVAYVTVPRNKPTSKRALTVVVMLLLGGFGILAYFKYLPGILEDLGLAHWASLALPLGISYFTFKLVHYVVEVWRGTMPPHTFGEFVGYVLLFPTFTIGPIERFDHCLTNRQLNWHSDLFIEGLTRIIHGLIKRFALIDVVLPSIWGPLPPVAQLLDHLPESHSIEIWWFLVKTHIFAYLEFSAYSDLAIGSSRLFGFRIMENFRFPIVATNIADFWRRWHMTLAGWCQSYVYMPMLGITRRPYLATYASFLIIGLWHAGTMQWLVWGMYHATGIVVHSIWRRTIARRLGNLPGGWWSISIGWLVTLMFVSAAYSFTCTFPDHTFRDSLRILGKLLGLNIL